MHISNGAYGHRKTINRYAQRNLLLPLPFILQHGWIKHGVLSPRPYELVKGAPLMAWSKSCAMRSERYGMPTVGSIGSPFLYRLIATGRLSPLGGAIQARPAQPKTIDTLLVPDHTSRKDSIEVDHSAFLDEALAGSSESNALAMLHPDDFADDEVLRIYRERGIKTFANTEPLHSESFVSFLASILDRVRVLRAQSLQTAFWYASAMGCEVHLCANDASSLEAWVGIEQDLGNNTMVKALEKRDQNSWREAMKVELGFDDLLNANEMADLLAHLSGGERSLKSFVNVARSEVLGSSLGMKAREILMRRSE